VLFKDIKKVNQTINPEEVSKHVISASVSTILQIDTTWLISDIIDF